MLTRDTDFNAPEELAPDDAPMDHGTS